MGSIIYYTPPRTEFWVRHDTQATKEMRLWYPRPKPKENIHTNPSVAKRVLGLLEYGYRIDELSGWFRLAGSRANTNTAEANRTWEDIKTAYNNRCAYCGKPSKRLTKDHVVPISQSGSDTMDNIVPACKSCNLSKRAKHPLDWGKFRRLQLHMLGFKV